MERTELERELERLHTACWGWALACCGRDRDLAEEALQTAYLRILSGQARFDGRSSFQTWAFGVIRRTSMEETRRARRDRSRASEDPAELALASDPAAPPDILAEQSDERTALTAALATLSTRQREVLHLVFYHGMTLDDAARVMELSAGSARTHYDRAKKAMALALAPRVR
jgi:RNA polymerase sigma-70 factor (ECF subfamily)